MLTKPMLATALLAALVLALPSHPARAQGAPQTVSVVRVDVAPLATGFRASKVIGATVTNDANETIGKIDDVIISADGKAPFAVISVGGFLGLGSKLVVVHYDNLRFQQDRVVLPGGSKEQLKALPDFKYARK
ncbi:MAG TPA: PRC-barrel domain-containing protein [Aliidongia sp.]|nr:PRC-barrel domain-containing protein [Aliidongia sp.]